MTAGRGGGFVAAQFVLTAAIALSALVGLESGPAFYAVGGALLAAGAALMLAAGRRLGRALTPFPAPLPGHELRTGGVYRLVRHPMYGGGVLVALGWSVLFESVLGVVLTVVLLAFFALKSRHEERWLEQAYPGYAEYRRHTPRRFLPFLL